MESPHLRAFLFYKGFILLSHSLMRTLTSISLLLLLLLNLFGFYVSFFLNREGIKEEMVKTMTAAKRNSLEQFEFTTHEYRQLTRPDGKDDELIINTLMYDVKGVEFRNDKVIVFAKKDISETNLIKKFLSEINDQSSSSRQRNSNLLTKVLQQEFVFIETNFELLITITHQRIVTKQFSLISTYFNQSTPPPDLILS